MIDEYRALDEMSTLAEAAAHVGDLVLNGARLNDSEEPITFTIRPRDVTPQVYLGLAMAQAQSRKDGDMREVRRLGILLKQIERAWSRARNE